MRQLRPLPLREKYWDGIEAEIMRLWNITLFEPLARALAAKPYTGIPEIINALNPLVDAIAAGRVYYEDGRFQGEFSAAISKALRELGAEFLPASHGTPQSQKQAQAFRRGASWRFPAGRIPPDIRIAQATANGRYDKMRDMLIRTIDAIKVDGLSEASGIPDRYLSTIDHMETDFQKTVNGITIPPKLTAAQRGTIAAEWGQNLDLYIRDWAKENIIELRQKVQGNTFAGRRSSDLVKMIQQNYGVGQRKAKFLARQETALLMSKFRETRYKDIGLQTYRWSTSHDERVRHDHKELNGKVFSWDNPPITNRETGQRNNPGEDFGCRCVAVALIE